MEIKLKARQIGGSIGLIIPREIVELERITADDILKVKIEKTGDLSFLWGRLKDMKKSTDRIMDEIDEGENDY